MAEVQQGHQIDVNEYGPDVKSLGFKTPEGDNATIGVINPGKEQTFPTDLKEMVTIISGRLEASIEGIDGSIILETGQTFMFPPKSKITLKALDEHQVAYKCVYIPHEEKPTVDTASVAQAADQALKG